MWINKSQIEIGQTRSYGDINQGAYLNTSAPQNPTMFTKSAAADDNAVESAKPVASPASAI